MIRILCWDQQGNLEKDKSVEACADILQTPEKTLWMDFCRSSPATSRVVFQDIFKFHSLAIDDALEETHAPKIDDWEDYVCLVTQMIKAEDRIDSDLITQEVDIFIGRNYIITYHPEESGTVDKVWEAFQMADGRHNHSPENILYLLFDETATDFMENISTMELRLSVLEDQLFDNPSPSILEEIFSLKRSILQLQKSVGPQREVLNKLSRGDYPVIGNQSSMYFRDVYDHFSRLYEIIENLRDLTGNALEIYLSVVNNRMNGIMKTLTIITTLFMPISFLAGFFGMNFFAPIEHYVWWTSTPVLVTVILASILFPAVMVFYFVKKGWMK